MTICFGTSAENFVTSGVLFVATLFASSGSQKVYSETGFRSGDAVDAVIFIGEATSFMSSTLGFQKIEVRHGFRMWNHQR